MQVTISIKNGIARLPEWQLAQPVNLELLAGEHIAIVGPNGSGKTKLAEILIGKHPLFGDYPKYDFSPSECTLASENIRYITFKDCYGADNDRTYYLQQRWNQQEIDEETPTVRDKLEEALLGTPHSQDPERRREEFDRIVKTFQLYDLLDKYIILLSSGELRRMKIACSLVGRPRILMIDNPFVGLDVETRHNLSNFLGELAVKQDLQLIMILSRENDIPAFITHIIPMENCRLSRKMSVEEYLAGKKNEALSEEERRGTDQLINTLPSSDWVDSEEIIRMENVNVCYGDRTIIKDLNWQVKVGEKWALRGQNGSGKSTLLSLICADNPQAYACNISLFGHRRGTGESIWDIKKHIGYVSPEMHRAYKKNLPVIQVVASGLKDSIGLYAKPTEKEYATCEWWLSLFGMGEMSERGYLTLSEGEQRMVLLARAFVKNPLLLILDEPFHGLDDHNRALVGHIIEAFCQRKNKTLLFVTHYDDELPASVSKQLTLIKNN